MPPNPSKAVPKATSGPTAPVPKDPQPSIDRIDDLSKRVLTGDILLPKFQRDFVWEKKQILVLLDSIAKGFPIGSILLWQSRQELRSENRIAGLNIELPRPDYPVNYLLDGQQRLSTICGALNWEGEDANSRWNICFDLRTQEFSHLETLDDPPLHQMRVNKISDPAAFFKHVASLDTLNAADVPKLKENADLLFNRFKDYKIAVVTLGDMSIDDVAPVFERINSQGTPLTIVDLMRAATWSQDFDLIDSIQSILDDLADKGFQAIDRKVVLRNISAAAGGTFAVGGIESLRKKQASDLKSAVAATRDAYRLAADFLATQIGLPNAEILPYTNQMVVLAELFRSLPSPSAIQYSSIASWFWRSTAAEYFSGWNTGQMSRDQESIQKFASGAQAEIVEGLNAPSASIWTTRSFRANSAGSKLLAIVLGFHKPIDLLTGQRIDLGAALAWQNYKEYHHFFPRDYLLTSGKASLEYANRLANIIMLSSASNKKITNRAPSDYLRDVKRAAGAHFKDWLATNLISDDALAAARIDDYAGFLNARSLTIQTAVSQLAGW